MNKNAKTQLRNTILQSRNLITPEERTDAGRKVLDYLKAMPQFAEADNVFCYISFRSEIPTQNIIEYCLQLGKKVYIPVCVEETKEMVIARLDSGTEFVKTGYGLLEPSSSTIHIGDREQLDIALVPGAVFDKRGYRIGYGAGYYDKFFSFTDRCIYKAALAYSLQLVSEVPKDAHDVSVDCIVTEDGVIPCKEIFNE